MPLCGTTRVLMWLLVFGITQAGLVQRSNSSKSFAGSNEYFLHALPATEQRSYVETLAGWGVKVLRLWGIEYFPNLR